MRIHNISVVRLGYNSTVDYKIGTVFRYRVYVGGGFYVEPSGSKG